MVSIIIPTLNASTFLPGLLAKLDQQTIKEKEVIIIDSSSTDNTVEIARTLGARTIIIPRNEFNHGSTRNLGAREAEGDILVYMTQDAIPENEYLLEKLIAPIMNSSASASYSRQLAAADAAPSERFARIFNYTDRPLIKSKEDLPELGIKTFFFTNVCSAIMKKVFFEEGCFPENVIMNEDIIFSAKLILNGHRIAYVPDARVIHSHNYSLKDQFKRYFDIGVAFNRQRWFLELANAEGEGFSYIKNHISYLWKEKQIHWIPFVFAETAAKYAGYRLGLSENILPLKIKKLLSMHRFFWARQK